jgi:hypothetical protein
MRKILVAAFKSVSGAKSLGFALAKILPSDPSELSPPERKRTTFKSGD